MRLRFRFLCILATGLLAPMSAFAIEAPPPPGAPFFSWLAVPVVAVAGHRLLRKKKSTDDSDRPARP